MLRLKDPSLVNRRRTLRALYAQTQATPYAATLSPNFDRAANQLTGAAATAGSQAAINPGSVAVKLAGETVTLFGSTEAFGTGGTATATTPVVRPFGLFANFVGGNMDELFGRSEVGVWRGPDSVFEILAPAFNDTAGAGLSTADTSVTAATETYVESGADGRLQGVLGTTLVSTGANISGPGGAHQVVGRLIRRLSANAIIVELMV
jgi:hypothetical protein